jgi:hypothetical protein
MGQQFRLQIADIRFQVHPGPDEDPGRLANCGFHQFRLLIADIKPQVHPDLDFVVITDLTRILTDCSASVSSGADADSGT